MSFTAGQTKLSMISGVLERFPFIWKNRWEFSAKWKKVVPLWNQMERFFPLVILGNKPRVSPRSMVREFDRGKWFSDIPVISVTI